MQTLGLDDSEYREKAQALVHQMDISWGRFLLINSIIEYIHFFGFLYHMSQLVLFRGSRSFAKISYGLAWIKIRFSLGLFGTTSLVPNIKVVGVLRIFQVLQRLLQLNALQKLSKGMDCGSISYIKSILLLFMLLNGSVLKTSLP